MNIEIKNVLHAIKSTGFDAFIVGGYCRDKIMGLSENNDVDIATNAPLDIVLNLFLEYSPKVLKYNTIKFKKGCFHFDIAHYRHESIENGQYIVRFTDNVINDYERRDFSINAIYMDENDNIIDKLGGVDDCKNHVIRFVGNVRERLIEDPSRMLRYIYFIVRYDLNPLEKEYNYIKEHAYNFFTKCSHHDVVKYVRKILKLNRCSIFLKIITDFSIVSDLFSNYSNFDSMYAFLYSSGCIYTDLISKKDQDILKNVNSIVIYGAIDTFTLLKYSFDENYAAAEIMQIPFEFVKKTYDEMSVKNINSISITKNDISKMLDREVDEKINSIYNNIIKLIAYGELDNSLSAVSSYLDQRRSRQ